ncbi:MAG: hypothetical protein R2827_02390 [Bdellovibrionales bacterium]
MAHGIQVPDEYRAPHDLWSRHDDRLYQRENETDVEFAERQAANENTRNIFMFSVEKTAQAIKDAVEKYQAYLNSN